MGALKAKSERLSQREWGERERKWDVRAKWSLAERQEPEKDGNKGRNGQRKGGRKNQRRGKQREQKHR